MSGYRTDKSTLCRCTSPSSWRSRAEHILRLRDDALRKQSGCPFVSGVPLFRSELIQQVLEAFARDRHLELVAHRKVGQRQPGGRMGLTEEDLLLLPMLGTPGAHAPLQRAQHPVTEDVAVPAVSDRRYGATDSRRNGASLKR